MVFEKYALALSVISFNIKQFFAPSACKTNRGSSFFCSFPAVRHRIYLLIRHTHRITGSFIMKIPDLSSV